MTFEFHLFPFVVGLVCGALIVGVALALLNSKGGGG